MVACFRNELLTGRFGLVLLVSLSLVMFGGCPTQTADDGGTTDNSGADNSGTDGNTNTGNNQGNGDDASDAELFTLTHIGSVVVDTDEYTAKSVITGTAEIALTPNESTTVAVPYTISVDIDGKTADNGDQYVFTPGTLALEGTLRWTVDYTVDGAERCVEVSAAVFNADSQLVAMSKITTADGTVDLGTGIFQAFADQLGGTVVPPLALTDESCDAPYSWEDTWNVDESGVFTEAEATVIITPKNSTAARRRS